MDTFLEVERVHKNKARVMTAITCILFLILLLLPWFTYQNPPPGQEGTIVNLGTLGIGQGEENAPESQQEIAVDDPSKAEEQKETPKEEPSTPEKAKTAIKKEKSKKEPETSKKVIKDNSETLALAEAKKKKEDKKRKIEAEKKRKKEAEKIAAQKAEAKEKKEAEEKRIAAEKAAKQKADKEKAEKEAKLAEANDLKNNLKDLFGKSGEGEGKGQTGLDGNQGVKGGDPDAAAVEGISSGSGVVSGGLAGRGGSGPGISDNSNKAGTLMVKVCVDTSGKVTSANYTQKGSTITDQELKNLAVKSAYKWSFKSGSAEKQCGFIKYVFKVK